MSRKSVKMGREKKKQEHISQYNKEIANWKGNIDRKGETCIESDSLSVFVWVS